MWRTSKELPQTENQICVTFYGNLSERFRCACDPQVWSGNTVTTCSIVQRFKYHPQCPNSRDASTQTAFAHRSRWNIAFTSMLIATFSSTVVMKTVADTRPLASFSAFPSGQTAFPWEPLNGNVKVWLLRGERPRRLEVPHLEGGRCAFAVTKAPQISAAATTWEAVTAGSRVGRPTQFLFFSLPFFCCQDEWRPRDDQAWGRPDQ